MLQSFRVQNPRRLGQAMVEQRTKPFELLLFATNTQFIERAVVAGVNGIIVDCEHIGKEARQRGADTEINYHTIEDLRRVRACTRARVLCRINRFGTTTPEEIEHVIAAGADEILLPMVQTTAEVEHVLDQIRGRCQLGILVETVPALSIVAELGRLPLARVYLGLNDLGIARNTPNIFTAVADGTVEYVRQHFHVPFGFGGVTVPEGGFPIPCHLLIGELARLECNFTFLRRSFWADMSSRDMMLEVPRIRSAITGASQRSEPTVAVEQATLYHVIATWKPETRATSTGVCNELAVGY